MSVPSPLLINSFGSFLLITYPSSPADVKCFWQFNCKKLHALSEVKTKFSYRCGLNYSLISFKIYWHLPPDFMPEHRL